eukprot:13839736-Ditylum_brightwellii.AAC.1
MKYDQCDTTVSTVDKLTEQLCSTRHGIRWNLPSAPATKLHINGDSTNQQLKHLPADAMHVNHLRRDTDNILAEKATSSLIISDNQDEIHASVLCTKAIYQFALCAKFATNTGTIVPCSFSLDSQGLLVAMNRSVSIQYEGKCHSFLQPRACLKKAQFLKSVESCIQFCSPAA